MIATFRTECLEDASTIKPILEALKANIVNESKDIDNLVTITINTPETDLETFKDKFKTAIEYEAPELHRCYQTLTTGHKPNERFYKEGLTYIAAYRNRI